MELWYDLVERAWVIRHILHNRCHCALFDLPEVGSAVKRPVDGAGAPAQHSVSRVVCTMSDNIRVTGSLKRRGQTNHPNVRHYQSRTRRFPTGLEIGVAHDLSGLFHQGHLGGIQRCTEHSIRHTFPMTVLIALGSEGVCKVECVLMYLEAAASTCELYFIVSWPLSGDNSGFYMLAPPVHGRWSFTSRGSDSRTCRVKVARR